MGSDTGVGSGLVFPKRAPKILRVPLCEQETPISVFSTILSFIGADILADLRLDFLWEDWERLCNEEDESLSGGVKKRDDDHHEEVLEPVLKQQLQRWGSRIS